MSDKDERDNILVMFDDEGNEQELYVFGSVKYNNDIYLIVIWNLMKMSKKKMCLF